MNGPSREMDPVSAIALLDEPTRRRLYEFVAAQDEPVSRDQAGAAAGISRELAAFHLDRLAAGGLLVTEYRRLGARRGPGGGRPAKLYRRSREDVAVSLPARDYERLATDLADALGDVKGRSAATAAAGVATTRGAEEGREIRRQAGRRLSRAADANRQSVVRILASFLEPHPWHADPPAAVSELRGYEVGEVTGVG